LKNSYRKDVLDELKEFYSILSRKWIHAPSYLNELLQDTLRRGGELPVKILYFPLLEEREDEINELVRILNKFNKYALILVKEWKEKCLRNK
jgi:hypothetical protein